MEKNKWEVLRDDFPKLFTQRIPMECGEGWEPLVRTLCEKLDLLFRGSAYKGPEGSIYDEAPFQVEQVKEKFGGLRFYVSWGTPEIWGLIEEAEAESFKVCEECGKEGKLTGKRWLRTLCEGCESKFSKKDP